jgi:CRISPR-associated protein Cas2
MDEHLYIISYDIREPRRWRRTFKLLHAYGEWVQLSVFQCRLSSRRKAELFTRLDEIIHHKEDHVMIIDLGTADTVKLRIISLGKTFEPLKREPLVV